MNDLFLPKSTDSFKIELALLCSRIQLYYLIQWRIWRYRNKQKVREAQKQLMLLSDIRSEFAVQSSREQLNKYYLHLNEFYRHELVLVEYILEQYPDLLLMPEWKIVKVMEKSKKLVELKLVDITSYYQQDNLSLDIEE